MAPSRTGFQRKACQLLHLLSLACPYRVDIEQQEVPETRHRHQSLLESEEASLLVFRMEADRQTSEQSQMN